MTKVTFQQEIGNARWYTIIGTDEGTAYTLKGLYGINNCGTIITDEKGNSLSRTSMETKAVKNALRSFHGQTEMITPEADRLECFYALHANELIIKVLKRPSGKTSRALRSQGWTLSTERIVLGLISERGYVLDICDSGSSGLLIFKRPKILPDEL